MQIYVKTTTCKTEVALEVEPDETIESLKSKLREAWEIPVSYNPKLAYRGDRLENCRFVSDYNIQNGSKIQLLLPGGKAKLHFLLDTEETISLTVKWRTTMAEMMERILTYQETGVLEDFQHEEDAQPEEDVQHEEGVQHEE